MGSKLRKEDIINKINELGIYLEDGIRWTNDKMIKKLGDYYLGDDKSFARNFIQSMETVQLCHHLKDEIQFFKTSPLERDDFISEFKLNGCRCLHGTAMVQCEDGIERSIKDIVDNKLNVKVLTFNEVTQENEYQPIIGWFDNGKKVRSQWVNIKGMAPYASILKVTKDHKVFTHNRGYIEAQEINKDDYLDFRYKGCNDTQLQVLYGSFLGDGNILAEKRSVKIPRYRLRLAQCEKQLPYLKLKVQALNNSIILGIKQYMSGYGSLCFKAQTQPMWDINKYLADNIKNKEGKTNKVITIDLLEQLDWLGWAIWYMDDGYTTKNHDMDNRVTNKVCRAQLALCRYSKEECLLVQQYLLDTYNISSTIQENKGNYIMVIDAKSSPLFFQYIAPYVPECMNYKLPPEYQNITKILWYENNKHIMNSIPLQGFYAEEHYHLDPSVERPKAGMRCFDIEVAQNHNFYANGMLVHNCITCYSPEEGLRFFSRNETVTNFLNNEFTEKLIFINNGVITKGSDYIGKFPCRFVLDGELLVDDDTLNFEGRHYDNMEDFLQGILSSLPQRAINYQMEGHPIRLTCYDIMYFEPNPSPTYHNYKYDYTDRELSKAEVDWVLAVYGTYLEECGIKKKYDKTTKLLFNYLYSLKDLPKYDVRRLPFYKRRQARRKVLEVLGKAGLPFGEVDGEDNFKIDYLDNVLRSGGEGILVKNVDAPYIAALKSSRSHKACMKVKQSVSEMMKNDGRHMDFDVFITGCNPPKSDRIKDMIGALKCSIYLENEFGEVVEHEIANISGIPHEWKRKLALVQPDGKITLNPEYLGKVIAIDGMALSHNSLRFQHAVLKEKEGLVFKDKAPKDCEWTHEALEKMVIVRGFE